MTATSLELPALYVEGNTDLHTIRQLMMRHGIALDETTGPVVIKDAESDKGVLRAMQPAAKASTGQPVGRHFPFGLARLRRRAVALLGAGREAECRWVFDPYRSH